MAKCIVCKTHLERGTHCPRCNTDNRTWLLWQKHDPVEREDFTALLAFTKPNGHIPFVITALATFFGLLFAFTLWRDIRPSIRAIAVLITPVGCLLSVQAVYEMRREIRQNALLERARRGQGRRLSIETVSLLLPGAATAFVFALAMLLVRIDPFWNVLQWLVMTDSQNAGTTLLQRFLASLPVTSLIAYVVLSISFASASSLIVAQHYAARLNDLMPAPIFLQELLLIRVVQREAERAMRRPDAGMQNETEEPQTPGDWTWAEMRRTNSGGIELKAVSDKKRQDEDSIGAWMQRTTYVIEADCWSRIVRIVQEG